MSTYFLSYGYVCIQREKVSLCKTFWSKYIDLGITFSGHISYIFHHKGKDGSMVLN